VRPIREKEREKEQGLATEVRKKCFFCDGEKDLFFCRNVEIFFSDQTLINLMCI
jgi:chemotaxis methyl-accepting protein methylase